MTEQERVDDRIEKSAVGSVDALAMDELPQEATLLAVDSLPKLDTSTLRIEEVERLDDGMRRLTISGEKSEFCPTREMDE